MTDERVLKPYRVELAVAAGRDEVWATVTQPALLRQWFGWDYDGLHAEIRQIFVDEATLWAPERMGWADGSYLEVSGDDDTSTIRAVREGPPSADPEAYDAIEEGWRAFLTQLQFFLTERPAGARRTVYLTGVATAREATGLIDRKWERVGPRITRTVDGDGHLVVVAYHGTVAADEPTRTEVTVSTYGLDDAAFEACRDLWTRRWTAVAGRAEVTTAGSPAPGS
jgi:uncharacterized protein YndB with AHSA1/START domain